MRRQREVEFQGVRALNVSGKEKTGSETECKGKVWSCEDRIGKSFWELGVRDWVRVRYI